VSRVVRRFDVRLPFEQPFTLAECRGEPHGEIVPGPGARGYGRTALTAATPASKASNLSRSSAWLNEATES